ncbi:hypothetical protein [Maribacter sp.]|uniref:hypothetical protein n=1 Tax=Maribacter sp. TaxID=1897614 RepID=UPI003299958B
MMSRYYCLFLALFLLFSCTKDETDSLDTDDNDNPIGNATLVITVYEENTPVNEGVTVITYPPTKTLLTNSFGQVEIEDIPAEKYDVYAFIKNYGSGKVITSVKADEITSVDLKLIIGRLIEPSATITSPVSGTGFSENEEITFTGIVTDNNTENSNLAYEWSSNIDGPLANSILEDDGSTSLSVNSLTKSEHYITLSATNQLGIVSKDSILINTLAPPLLQLSSTKNSDSSISLNWGQLPSDIEKLEIIRYSESQFYAHELVTTITDQGTTFYKDEAVPFSSEVNYYIKYYNSSGYSRESNTVTNEGASIFNIQPLQAEIHNTKPLIYIRTPDQKILVFNYEEMAIVSEKTFEGTIGQFAIGNNGSGEELYVPNSDGWIYIYDLETLEYKAVMNVGSPVVSVITDNNGLVFSSSTPSPWWEDPLKIFDRSSLELLDGGGDFDRCILKLLPSGNEIIEITTSISPIDMDYYRFDSTTGMILEHTNDRYHSDHPLNAYIFEVAPNNNFLVTSSQGAVYSADSSMIFSGVLPRGSGTFSDFEFSSDATYIYAGLSNEKSIYTYDSSTLNKTGEMATKGYPIFMFRRDNTIISLSSPTQFDLSYSYYSYYTPNSFGVELINLQ